MFRRYLYRFALVSLASAATNFVCGAHVLALAERSTAIALALDFCFPWLGLIGLAWLIDDKSWTNRLVLTAASSVGLVAGTLVVFAVFRE